MQIQEPHNGRLNQGLTFLALGFRPFFLFSGISALLLMVLWLLMLVGVLETPAYYGSVHWHGHEMLYGYSAAVIAGFLLTAARNWTGIQTLRYWPLGGLVLVWLLGRLVPWLSMVPGWLIALVDVLFLPLLALALAFPLFKSRQKHNIPLVFLLLAMGLGNIMVHLHLLGWVPGVVQMGNMLGAGMIVTLLVVMGGRVIPFFIERGLPGVRIKKWALIERLAVPAMVLYVLALVFFPQTYLAALIIGATAVIQGWRVAGWYSHRIWTVSLVWVLWLGYTFLALGLAAQALAAARLIPEVMSLHLLTVGGIGVLTLGMMARVAIGHTGRTMRAHPAISWAFALMVVAAVVRGLLTMLLPEFYLWWLKIAGTLWIISFALFIWIYFPMLIRPRVDGQEG